jgi:hypothetical protein
MSHALLSSTLETYVKLFGSLAQGSVILLNEVPTNLIVGQLAALLLGSGSRVAGGGSRVTLESTLVLLLLTKAAVGGHGCDRSFGDERLMRL